MSDKRILSNKSVSNNFIYFSVIFSSSIFHDSQENESRERKLVNNRSNSWKRMILDRLTLYFALAMQYTILNQYNLVCSKFQKTEIKAAKNDYKYEM